MKQLWAPWRRDYILGPKVQGCIFCKALEEDPREALVLSSGAFAFVMLNRYPYINGHLLISPRRHVAHIEELEEPESAQLMARIRQCVRIFKEVYRPDGFNLGMNLGKVAGAGVEEHLHFHLLPRWNGDTNFMSVVGETRVISELLSTTWDTLVPFFAEK
ncbi:MAG: HIT domain-containing protein [bacterium]